MARGLVAQPSGMQKESSQSNIWKHVRASQNQHLVQLLEASLQKEDRRLARLVAATGNAKAKRRLEMHFNVERDRERKLFELVKQDHDVTLRSKMKAARVQKTLSTISTTNKQQQPTDASRRPPPKPPKLRHASSSSDASTKKHPCHQSSQVVQIRANAIPSRLRPLTTSSANNVARERLTPVQVDAFRMYVTQKLENAPTTKLRDRRSSAWLTADNVHEVCDDVHIVRRLVTCVNRDFYY
ncbi:hypothetical protein, variant [Aphanomyces astaci]|uniref:Uncharacterized protein n=1 Tax=Aphanomyces astaci TaxID=112090 RepID=W4G3Q6_APHAT|nr:hypothetical protein, variant [Aphanomyces astaci]ETV73664.1 hypothetical protein, variant [Aphanomyces astaci]|eukprot:XP_009837090.1 hypothetical protein, variant [Aphanomyces astaci]